MSKLFIFGDSFVNRTMVQFSDGSVQDVFKEQTWQVQLGRKLNCDEIINYGMIGSGIDFSLWRLLSLFQKDSEYTIDPENDFIIFALSNAERKWMIQEAPEASNILNLQFPNFVQGLIKNKIGHKDPYTKKYFNRFKAQKQIDVALQWLQHINRPELIYIDFIAYISLLKELKRTKKLNLYIIPAIQDQHSNSGMFDDLQLNDDFVHGGTLQYVSLAEFVGGQKTRDAIMLPETERSKIIDFSSCRTWNSVDGRINHLSFCNHDILAEKLYQSIVHKVPLDLLSGFKQEFITEENKVEHSVLYNKPETMVDVIMATV